MILPNVGLAKRDFPRYFATPSQTEVQGFGSSKVRVGERNGTQRAGAGGDV